VYIAEAHAEDEWPIGSTVRISQHRSLSERIEACTECIEQLKIGMRVVVDTMQNSFDNSFAAWPIRHFLVRNRVLQSVAHVGTDGLYSIDDVHMWIKS
jgi:hypothetical protein